MNNSKTSLPDLSRRKFLGACCASVGATGMLSALAQLRLIGAVADTSGVPARAAAPQPDFKALVCLFLSGGNDANNLIIPTDSPTYNAYSIGRGALALAQNAVLPITPRTNDGRSMFRPKKQRKRGGHAVLSCPREAAKASLR